jgi:uncharacterized protein with NRDE domain
MSADPTPIIAALGIKPTCSAREAALGAWLGLTPAAVVAATLNLDRDTVAAMRKDKPLIMP